ncbi:DNA (cytosine-5-)-methyltransferase [Shewanella metallivivens]|uniref:Cytosine-specific methyltransferase n=1 Tax=Shewanella metallivivens TaxID=2872342 RepID=A0ABT5TSF4_9GAMM|nr:DNA (cytosine-5-)-methyltransferase [Shewanella metallivivens]MDD8060346.1 DNA (cytosine-5-)-methyltransferase [Shewanella metallivivens]
MVKDIVTLGDELNEHFHKDDELATRLLFKLLIEIYDQKNLAIKLNEIGIHVSRENLNKWSKKYDSVSINLDAKTRQYIESKLLPPKPQHWDNASFEFIDLFAGIGGIRKGFEDIGGKCVFTSELDRKARKTYLANYYVDKLDLPYFIDEVEENPHKNTSFMDITEVTQSKNTSLSEIEKTNNIRQHVPHHDVLLAGFPCQPFSIAGVSKKISLGRAHGFECDTQGTLFFDVEKIIEARKPKFFVLENVKNLKSHDKGNTFATIIRALDKLGYWLLDISNAGKDIEDAIVNVRKRKVEPTIIDGIHFTPQHRERVVLVGIRNDLIQKYPDLKNLSLSQIEKPESRYTLSEILSDLTEAEVNRYTLTPNLWNYLYHYALKHKTKGNGFGFGLVDPRDEQVTTRTLSARYYKDGSEILVNHQGLENEYLEEKKQHGIFKNQEREKFAIDHALKSLNEIDQSQQCKELIKQGEKAYDEIFGRYTAEFDPLYKTPRSLTPRECARLMGFEKPKFDRTEKDHDFKIVCANASSYKQFGNSVVVPVFRAVAKLLNPVIEMTKTDD